MKLFYQKGAFYSNYISRFLTFLIFCILGFAANAQCPDNIDFEKGNFTGWSCFTGTVQSNTGLVPNWIPQAGPVNNQHTMLSLVPGDGMDFYGSFPQNCPNGSGHSIRLGNNQTQLGAERVKYTFTIPAGQNDFSLSYYYAVVLQDLPSHTIAQKPKFRIDVINVTDGNVLNACASFDFSSDGSLPGFFVSPNSPSGTFVRCKDWSAASINLDGNAGKTIEITFSTTDCAQGGHFGYAYIDVNTECTSSFVGATFCHDDTTVNVRGPNGYQAYKWFNSTFTQVLGNQQVLNFTPPPAPGTTVAVEITPYNGYGCLDTLYAVLIDTLTVTSAAGRDTFSCNHAPVQLGGPAKQGIVYSWTPTAGLNNPNISNPVASPDITTDYVVSTASLGGGCKSTDTVHVGAAVLDNTLSLTGSASYCSASGDSAVLKVAPADSIQWYLNNIAIPGATQPSFKATQSGLYHATVFSFAGCNSSTAQQQININPSPVAGFTINNVSQCFIGHQFDFTSISTVPFGALAYNWDLGDLTSASTATVTKFYTQPGTYEIKLFVTAQGGCIDSIKKTIQVQASPDTALQLIGSASFCENRGQSAVLKVNAGPGIQWFKDNIAIPGATQPQYNVIQSGAYYAVLTSSSGCILATATRQVDIYPTPVARFSINNDTQCFGANQFVFTNGSTLSSGLMQYAWDMGDGNTFNIQDVTNVYASPGKYTVKLVTNADHGCSDSISLPVTIHQFPKADFTVQPICVNLQVPVINKTINNTASQVQYLWEFGNTASSTDRNPVYSYPAAGTYTVRLQVNTAQCPQTIDTMEVDVTIDAPVPGINYQVKNAVINFPEPLQARLIGNTVLWTPGNNLDTRGSYAPVFRSFTDQLYTIKMTTVHGCVTIDTQLVKTYKKIDIYVPTVFTPGNDGKNDLLRPLLMSFKEVHYFRIFDRWGKLLFEMKSDRPGWDGTVKGIPQEMQSVVWMIEAVDIDGKVHTKKGTTLLMR